MRREYRDDEATARLPDRHLALGLHARFPPLAPEPVDFRCGALVIVHVFEVITPRHGVVVLFTTFRCDG